MLADGLRKGRWSRGVPDIKGVDFTSELAERPKAQKRNITLVDDPWANEENCFPR